MRYSCNLTYDFKIRQITESFTLDQARALIKKSNLEKKSVPVLVKKQEAGFVQELFIKDGWLYGRMLKLSTTVGKALGDMIEEDLVSISMSTDTGVVSNVKIKTKS